MQKCETALTFAFFFCFFYPTCTGQVIIGMWIPNPNITSIEIFGVLFLVYIVCTLMNEWI